MTLNSVTFRLGGGRMNRACWSCRFMVVCLIICVHICVSVNHFFTSDLHELPYKRLQQQILHTERKIKLWQAMNKVPILIMLFLIAMGQIINIAICVIWSDDTYTVMGSLVILRRRCFLPILHTYDVSMVLLSVNSACSYSWQLTF